MNLTRRTLLFSLAAAGLGRSSAAAKSTITRRATAFGTIVSLTASGGSDAQVNAAIDASFAQIRAIEKSMSVYDADSEISRLNRTGRLPDPSHHFETVLSIGRDVFHETGGAFDPTVQPLWLAWRSGQERGRLPNRSELAAPLATVGFGNFSLKQPHGRQLTFNGIAQGYACDLVAAELARHGIASATFDTGEPGRFGTSSNTIALRHPRKPDAIIGTIDVTGGYLATSGDYMTSFTPDFSAHHIFDPATGFSPAELASVSVLARTGALADAYATAMMVMGSRAALELAARTEGLDVLLVDKRSKMLMSNGMMRRFTKAA
jgi:FAD:protein FMN transferase